MKYDAGSHTIGLITFKAAFDNTIGGLLDQIEGSITELPPVIDVTADLIGKVYTFDTNKPFGTIEALARNKQAVAAGLVPSLTDGSSGVSAVIRDGGPVRREGATGRAEVRPRRPRQEHLPRRNRRGALRGPGVDRRGPRLRFHT